MKFADLLKRRHSVRAYDARPIEKDRLNRVLMAPAMAPTAGPDIPYRIIILHTRDRKEELLRICKDDWFVQAPLVLAMVGLPKEGWIRSDGRYYYHIDCAAAMTHLILAAADEGLGTCWVADFDEDAAREVLGLPEGVEPFAFTPLGYPREEQGQGMRVAGNLESYIMQDKWTAD